MKDKFLEVELRLLILRHGRQRVVEMLAQLGEQTVEEVHQQLPTIEKRPKPARIKTSRPALVDLVVSECRGRPDVEEPLRAIAVNFENRTFLPQLRDAKRFFDQIGLSTASLKSRAEAGPVLVRALSKLSREELESLTKRDRAPREGDYSLLAGAIMGSHPSKQRD